MPRPPSKGLTDAELRVMNVLWDRGPSTVGDVVDAIDEHPKPAYNSVLTIVRILERKGYVTHDKEGRAFTYRALVDRGQERQRALSHMMRRLFDNSPGLLVADLLGHERLDADELRRVREILDRQRPARVSGRRRGGAS
jgi:predicted transcriptional regulator